MTNAPSSFRPRAGRFAAAAGLFASMLAACSSSPDRSGLAERYEVELRERNFLRQDVIVGDAPYSNAMLTRHFERVVFDHEEQLSEGIPGYADRELLVVKWAGPILYRLEGGGVRPTDETAVAALATRLAAYTGLEIRTARAGEEPTMRIFVMGPDERYAFLSRRRSDDPQNVSWSLESWVRQPQVPCSGFSRLRSAENAFVYAENFVSAELEGVLRLSCFHEEMAQALGLTNDHPEVRPSLFNDDQEFAVLTEHDGYLLRLLYHPAVKAGMRRDEAMPVVRRIVDEIRPRGRGRRAAG
ncbi:MAG: DUF2927 domain-containing protein [Pseudomonadota bacterium]